MYQRIKWQISHPPSICCTQNFKFNIEITYNNVGAVYIFYNDFYMFYYVAENFNRHYNLFYYRTLCPKSNFEKFKKCF